MAEAANTEISELKTAVNPDKEIVSIKSCYDSLKKEEAAPADPNELISIGKITPEDFEYQQLVLSGSTHQEIEERRIARSKLLEAGFIFNNHPLLAIEKPLINITIEGVNYGQRKLLTQEEIEKIKQYQRQHPYLYGTDQIETDEFREEMLSFLLTAKDNLPNHVKNKVNFLRFCSTTISHSISHNQLGKDKINQRALSLFQELFKTYMRRTYQDEITFIKEHLADVMPWEWEYESHARPLFGNIDSRGRKMSSFETRKTKLNGLSSPFLDSGFHFRENPDFQVVGSNGKFFRVNMLVLHLASRGVSEMGDGNVQNGEQDYSIGNYIRDLVPKTPEDKKRIKVQEERKFQIVMNFDQAELIDSVQKKLKELALAWAMQKNSPKSARNLAEKIKKLSLN